MRCSVKTLSTHTFSHVVIVPRVHCVERLWSTGVIFVTRHDSVRVVESISRRWKKLLLDISDQWCNQLSTAEPCSLSAIYNRHSQYPFSVCARHWTSEVDEIDRSVSIVYQFLRRDVQDCLFYLWKVLLWQVGVATDPRVFVIATCVWSKKTNLPLGVVVISAFSRQTVVRKMRLVIVSSFSPAGLSTAYV